MTEHITTNLAQYKHDPFTQLVTRELCLFWTLSLLSYFSFHLTNHSFQLFQLGKAPSQPSFYLLGLLGAQFSDPLLFSYILSLKSKTYPAYTNKTLAHWDHMTDKDRLNGIWLIQPTHEMPRLQQEVCSVLLRRFWALNITTTTIPTPYYYTYYCTINRHLAHPPILFFLITIPSGRLLWQKATGPRWQV